MAKQRTQIITLSISVVLVLLAFPLLLQGGGHQGYASAGLGVFFFGMALPLLGKFVGMSH